MPIDQERLALFEEMRLDELDSAALYRALADASDGRRPETALDTLTREELGLAPGDLTGRSSLRGGLRMVAIAAVVGVASHFIGYLIGKGVSV